GLPRGAGAAARPARDRGRRLGARRERRGGGRRRAAAGRRADGLPPARARRRAGDPRGARGVPVDGSRLPDGVGQPARAGRSDGSGRRRLPTQGRGPRRDRPGDPRRGAAGGGLVELTAQNTAIVVDSTADFPEAPERFPNWRVVPLYVRFGDESFRDYVEL